MGEEDENRIEELPNDRDEEPDLVEKDGTLDSENKKPKCIGGGNSASYKDLKFRVSKYFEM